MKLLSKHWSHRFPVELSSEQATIYFGDSGCRLTPRNGALNIEVWGEKNALPQLQDIVLDHLQRFARRGETLRASWSRDE
ncbi:DUF2218 domain-containing protein [Paraburkholderia acidiphila]|uniref:DUF2218 domain-containing protein n=2 Tax=Paraburkholderia acidiphila TaxID=2571747 RepID=A0A7Z2G812_9BURK|nr:DUF2218 domain-containing protein [Paraburkholderia acidiphila]